MPNRSTHPLTLFPMSYLAVMALGLAFGPRAGVPAEPASPFQVLKLEGGSELHGELVEGGEPGVIRWKSPLFQQPLEFPAASINGLERRDSAKSTRAMGEFCVQLYSNDTLFGTLVGWSADRVQLKTASYGELSIQTSLIRSLFRWEDGNALAYRGPNGLDEWERRGNTDAIHVERGHIVMSRPHTAMDLDARLPDRCRVDIELAWSNRPNFAVLLGIGDGPKRKQHCFRIEVWDDSVVLLRELETRADLALIGKVASFYGEMRLSVFLDQSAGRATVISDVLQGAAEISVTDEVARVGSRLSIENRGKELRLKKLDVIRAERFMARQQTKEPGVQLADGRVLTGEIKGLDVQQGMLQFQQGENSLEVPVGDLVRFEVPFARGVIPQRSIRILTRDGTNLSGHLLHVGEQEIKIESPAIESPVSFPLREVMCLMGMFPEKPLGQSPDGREGKLIIGSTTISGHIGAANFTSDQATLAWQPAGAIKPTPLVQDVVGRIVYREPEGEIKPFQRTIPVRRAMLDTKSNLQPLTQEPYGRVYLRSGDDFPCHIKSIDSAGVVVETPSATQVKVPHERIQGLAMKTRINLNLEEAKRKRLLTLPRMQQSNPPTHLVVSRTGDYLRGRLIGLDEQSLTFETRLQTMKISRENLSHLIWLHPEELLAKGKQETGESVGDRVLDDSGSSKKKGMLIQTIQRDGGRLTLRPEQQSLKGIMGVSDILGLCHVQLTSIDQILINPPKEADPSQSPLAAWRLTKAPEPKVLQAENEETGTVPAGMESRLVGQLAPEIQLMQLDDQPFLLSQLRGQIVVLDFWASWCGPCIQWMPKVNRVVAEFEEQQVRLVAVNVAEAKETVRAMLDRFPHAPQVVLDVDGVAARAYAADSIPYVVVIDRLGRIARVFVGGGAKFEEELRTALREVATP